MGNTQTVGHCSHRGGYCKTDDYALRHAGAFQGFAWGPGKYEFMFVS